MARLLEKAIAMNGNDCETSAIYDRLRDFNPLNNIQGT